YARDAQPFFVVLASGSAIEMGGAFPSSMIQEARARLGAIKERGLSPRGGPRRFDRGSFGRGNPAQADPFGRGNSGERDPFGRGDSRGGPPPGAPFDRD